MKSTNQIKSGNNLSNYQNCLNGWGISVVSMTNNGMLTAAAITLGNNWIHIS